jgi:hypothetical protein
MESIIMFGTSVGGEYVPSYSLACSACAIRARKDRINGKEREGRS